MTMRSQLTPLHATLRRVAPPVVAAAVLLAAVAHADDCAPAWAPEFDTQSSVGGIVLALASFDDGNGPALYAGGLFTTAGGEPVNSIARWDGQSWSALGSGLNGAVFAMTVFDDGDGPALFVGGQFTSAGGVEAYNIARWDGQSWSAVGVGVDARVHALAVFDEGDGQALYVGGEFSQAGSTIALRLAKWDGQEWAPVASGPPTGGMSWWIRAIAGVHEADGPALYAGGVFTAIDGVAASNIARWNGQSWAPVGGGLNDEVYAIAEFQGDVYVGGVSTRAGGVLGHYTIARWDGGAWSEVDGGLNGGVEDLSVFDDGAGPALYACGDFTFASGAQVNRIAKWDGVSWSPLGDGLGFFPRTMAVFDGAPEPTLYVGGYFTESPSGGSYIAKWTGCASSANPADLNGDGVVDGADLGMLLLAWGPCPEPAQGCPADLDADGAVTGADLGLLLLSWG